MPSSRAGKSPRMRATSSVMGTSWPVPRAEGCPVLRASWLSGLMGRPLWVVVGVVLVLLGLLWTLQGTDVIGGSPMSGTTTWSVIGPVVLLVGVVVSWVGLRGRRP